MFLFCVLAEFKVVRQDTGENTETIYVSLQKKINFYKEHTENENRRFILLIFLNVL
jgi:hypothetical protein